MKEDKATHSATWKSPSNLAIVKYWGKKDFQEPVNPSVSFSLSRAYTKTTVSLAQKKGSGFTFYLDNREEPGFRPRIQKFLDHVRARVPLIGNHHINIFSTNTFPHSSGIASSASAMSALVLCLADLQQQVSDRHHLNIREVSSLARMGSGSAARSVYGGWSIWGRIPEIPESSDHYAIPLPNEIHPLFKTLHDDVLIVSGQSKKVSSSAGHAMMNDHPYREGRIIQARENTLKLIRSLEQGNMDDFIEVTENEALSLHGLMMSSMPSYTLLHPNSLRIIREISVFREATGLPVTFSLDAGPNIHLLYPHHIEEEIIAWEQKQLQTFCEDGRIIRDRIGSGPEKIIDTNR
ncbi:MAG: diphosphomevalonate decarboxylase [Anaerophaga sp.]|nr:diphosphomevalonate decarboxylase [Anaerophaga sp.]